MIFISRKISRLIRLIVLVGSVFALQVTATARDSDEKRLFKKLDDFVVKSAETKGDWTYISIIKWRNEVREAVLWTTEDTFINMSDAFKRMNPQFEVISSEPVFETKKKGFIEFTFIHIHHKSKLSPPLR